LDQQALGRDAAARRDWQAAYDAYAAIDDPDATQTEGLAEAAWWLGRMDEAIRVYADAYRLHLEADDPGAAALAAVQLGIHTRLVGEAAQSDGWIGRAVRLVDSLPESPAHGYPLYLRIAALMGANDLDAAFESARYLHDLGRRFADPTLSALGVYYEGRVLIKRGDVREGLALLDEAMVAALSDQLGQIWTGAIYCGLMDACNELRDLRRAFEWTEATRRWCDPLPLTSLYPGICRVHRAQVLQTRGDWDEAEQEALGACEDMVGIDVFAVADANYEVGEVRRLRGDLPSAEDAYLRAHEYGRDPQPGLALLRLAQGKVDLATASIAAALASGAGSRLEQARLHAAQVEVALAAGDLALADASAQVLATTASDFASNGLAAEAQRCTGAVHLANGRYMEALAALRVSANGWQELDAPFEVACTRRLLAEAYRGLGDVDAADREEAAVRACFDRLGVRTDAPELPRGLTAREVEVVRLIASGMSNRSIAETLFLSEKTVARHVSNILGKLDVPSRAGVTAFAYDTGLMGRSTHS